jgi:hypothetical protein
VRPGDEYSRRTTQLCGAKILESLDDCLHARTEKELIIALHADAMRACCSIRCLAASALNSMHAVALAIFSDELNSQKHMQGSSQLRSCGPALIRLHRELDNAWRGRMGFGGLRTLCELDADNNIKSGTQRVVNHTEQIDLVVDDRSFKFADDLDEGPTVGASCRCLNPSTSMGGTCSKVEGGDRHDLEPEGTREDTRHKIYTGSGSRSSYPTSCLE